MTSRELVVVEPVRMVGSCSLARVRCVLGNVLGPVVALSLQLAYLEGLLKRHFGPLHGELWKLALVATV